MVFPIKQNALCAKAQDGGIERGNDNMKKRCLALIFLLAVHLGISGCGDVAGYTNEIQKYGSMLLQYQNEVEDLLAEVPSYASAEELPPYDGNPFVVIDDNVPGFTEEEITDIAYETYSELDLFGRCGPAEACVGQEIMPTEERGSIGQVKPSGWHTVKYDCVDGKYLYNRCHLLGYQLTGENSNERNLITGTRYLNVTEMLPFENMVAEYVKETSNHVMYRVTPVFEGKNLLAAGVEMEAYSVEDEGEGVSFHVFCYNVQPGVEIDYATGESGLSENEAIENNSEETKEYILNTNSFKYHLPTCDSVDQMSEQNKKVYKGNKKDLENAGYSACKSCNP